ncbi:MAG: peptide-methionine (R)-S-oxide reductase MsrB [Verrucomicrobiota bacterium]
MKRFLPLLLLSLVALAVLGWQNLQANPLRTSTMPELKVAPPTPPAPVEKTEEAWRAQLTPEQYYILRESGTEPPFGAVYRQTKDQGAGQYHCAGCGALVFDAAHKFDSGTGWPSFYDIAEGGQIELLEDRSHGMVRTEVRCKTCQSHLGHLFLGENYGNLKDQRYCINGLALVFVPTKE